MRNKLKNVTASYWKPEFEATINGIFHLGVRIPRRASMLMAFGLNASRIEQQIGFRLPGFVQFVETPDELPPHADEDLREQFRQWTVANGFRELLEGMETCLGMLFPIIVDMQLGPDERRSAKKQRLINQFDAVGVWKKLDQLEKQYGFQTGMAPYFRSLTQARNCLTHRFGVVGEKDCGGNNTLEVCWLGFEAEISEPDGTKHAITLDTIGPIRTSRRGGQGNPQLTTTFVDRRLSFKKGEQLVIPPRTLQEICWMSIYTTAKVHQLVINWLLDNRIFVNRGLYLPEPKAELIMEMTPSVEDEIQSEP